MPHTSTYDARCRGFATGGCRYCQKRGSREAARLVGCYHMAMRSPIRRLAGPFDDDDCPEPCSCVPRPPCPKPDPRSCVRRPPCAEPAPRSCVARPPCPEPDPRSCVARPPCPKPDPCSCVPRPPCPAPKTCEELLENVAEEEMALARILSAEGEKLRGIIESTDDFNKLLEANRVADCVLNDVMGKEQGLFRELKRILELCGACEPKPEDARVPEKPDWRAFPGYKP